MCVCCHRQNAWSYWMMLVSYDTYPPSDESDLMRQYQGIFLTRIARQHAAKVGATATATEEEWESVTGHRHFAMSESLHRFGG